MTFNEILTLATELKNKNGLSTWKISFNRRKGSFGLCSYTKREISFSSVLIPFMTDKAIKETIAHEIAHALTYGHGHNNVWRRKCIELGGTGERSGGDDKFKDGYDGITNYGEKNGKYTLTCPICGAKSYMNRKPKREYSCALHGNRFYNPKYKLEITQNY